MIDGLIHGLVLNAKAKTGANGEFIALTFAVVVCSVIAVTFFSLAAYVWLASLCGGAVAGLVVGSVHLAIAAVIVAKCIAVRRHNKHVARVQIELAAKQPGWRIDPGYVATGLEIVKIIGVRNLVPLAAAGLLAAGWGATRGKRAARGKPAAGRRTDGSRHHAGQPHSGP
jgi:hypothetical protein